MKKTLFTIGLICCMVVKIYPTAPDEGMWLPMYIEKLNYIDMQKMGLNLTVDELYNINNSSLKDAIVGLGRTGRPGSFFCTAEIVSKEGLMLTCHHCAYGAIQSHSSVEHNYLDDGFWAKNKEEELPNKGLTASILVRMDDVTSKIIPELNDTMSETQRADKIQELSSKIQKEASEEGKYDAVVRSFFEGNEFYLFIYQTYKDVRLVGAPPSSIGQFGGDTDNWMWPRHTGDFALLRIYTAPDGSPAEYSKDNIPLKPKHYLPISIKGVKKEDFAMIWGFPGGTDRYLTSYGIALAIEESNPTIVKIRDRKLSIMKEDMEANPEIKIKYAVKYAQTSNYWKYFIGQTKGLKALKIYDRKKKIEDNFQNWVNADSKRTEKYGNALKYISEGYQEMKKYNLSLEYLNEAVFRGPDIISFCYSIFSLSNLLEKSPDKTDAIKNAIAQFKAKAQEYFKDYNMPTDKKLFTHLLRMYYADIPQEQHPGIFKIIDKKYKGNFDKFADDVFNKSIFADSRKLNAFLEKPNLKTLNKDIGFQTTSSMVTSIREFYGIIDDIEKSIDKGNRLFVAGLREMNPDIKYYSDANSTLRMTYGQVLDYLPADAVHYDYLTTFSGIMKKEDPNNDEFVVAPKLKELYEKKDYGRYAKDNNMYVCFLSNNDITGGNSGSPIMNGDGQLIGVAFDGNWEAMSGDVVFEPNLQRTINVDIRYVLFVIDKFANATNIIDEMTIIE